MDLDDRLRHEEFVEMASTLHNLHTIKNSEVAEGLAS
jgi:hypothetical protein